MAINRAAQRARSNNSQNGNKNICALAVAQAFGCENVTRYLHNISDLVGAVRKKFTVRSRLSQVKGKTVGGARAKMVQLAKEVDAYGFIIRVDGHALLVGAHGRTIVDTDRRKSDRRKITHCYVVYRKSL